MDFLKSCTCCSSLDNTNEFNTQFVKEELDIPVSKVVTRKGSKEGGFARSSLIVTSRSRIDSVYTIESKTIGAGSVGVVKKAINKKTNAAYAVKAISKRSIEPDLIMYETHLMTILDHPNIIKLYETYEDARNVYLVMELCTGGELFDRIVENRMKNRNAGFSEKVVAKLAKQMVGAVLYMHTANIAHRDLKPDNFIFANENGISESPLKLVDFSASKQFEKGARMATQVFTLDYVAPEVFTGEYTERCDVWSLGVILYFLLSGQQPFQPQKWRKGDMKYEDQQLRTRIMKGDWNFNAPVWKNVSQDGKELISKMILLDPAKRFTSEQVMHHVWLQELAPHASDLTLSDNAFNNLEAFTVQNNLKKAALTAVAQRLSDVAINDLKEMFCALDANGNGIISEEEMCKGLKAMGVEDELRSMLTRIMVGVDSDGDCAIDFSEFMGAAIDEHHYIQEDVCWSSFRVFDIDGNQQITKDELAQMLSDGNCTQLQDAFDLDKAEIEKIMAQVDKNRDEKIDFDEFLAMMRKHEGHHA